MLTRPTEPIGPIAIDGATRTRVWDLGVRLFHWTLLALVAVAAATGFLASKSWVDVHVVAGTAIAALILFRIVWGFFGSTYARFSSFAVSPLTALRHALDLVRGRAPHHVGHNPIGAMMILALLATLALLTLTGAIVLGGAVKEGPLAPVTSFATGRSVKELHEFLAFGLLALVAAHVAGVVVESLRTRDNLVRAMVTGERHCSAADHGCPPVRPRRLAAAAVVTLLLGGAGSAIAHLSMQPALGVPTAPLDQAYAKECGACHTPHHPSLASAATWARVMASLSDHFGDNAEMDGAQATALLTYMSANSAEKWDTAAANRLRTAAADGSLKITDTDGWKRLHRKVPAASFELKKVTGRLNCAACHADAATGRFAPRSISIPKE